MSKNFGNRLREERVKRNLTQEEIAIIGGVKITAQSNYERSHRLPDADYLMRLAENDFDVTYLLTGTRDQNRNPLNKRHSRIISAFETADPTLVIAALRVLGINDIEITKS